MTEWICKEKQMIRQGDGATICVGLVREKELVRCKDCKYGAYVAQIGTLPFVTCGGVDRELDWFCADGERCDDDG